MTYVTVKQARKLKTVKIVSFDWLEDSLMKQRPKNVREYLMAPITKAKVETKVKKKILRKKNIAKGSVSPLLTRPRNSI